VPDFRDTRRASLGGNHVESGDFRSNALCESMAATRLEHGIVQKLRPRMSITLERRVYLALAVSFLAMLATGTTTFVAARDAVRRSTAVSHTHEVRRELGLVLSTHLDLETGSRGYVITGSPEYLEPFTRAGEEADRVLAILRALVRDNPVQTRRLEVLAELLRENVGATTRMVETRSLLGAGPAIQLVGGGGGKRLMDQVRAEIAVMDAEEVRLLAERTEEERASIIRQNLMLAASGVVSLFVLVFGGVVIHRDFGRRQQAERALRELNDTLEQRVRDRTAQAVEQTRRAEGLLEAAPDPVIITDRNGRIVIVNARTEAVFGYPRADLVGRAVESLIPTDDGARAHPGTGHDIIARRSDGGEFAAEVSRSPLDTPAETLVISTVRDVTERRQAERRIRGQLEHLALLDHITRATGERQDIKSIFQVVVRSLEESLPVDFGCVCLHDAAANSLTVISAGTQSAALARELTMDENASIDVDSNGLSRCVHGQLVYEPDIGQSAFPFPRRLADGGLRSLVLAPLKSESRVFGVLIVARREAHAFESGECEFLRQLSEHVALAALQAQLYGSLQQAYDDLRHTQQAAVQQERLRALGQMASGIAHDINNALSPVSLYTESMLETESLSDNARSKLETIQRAVEDVSQTVARMREFYRQREQQAEFAPVDLNLLAQQVLDLTRVHWSDMAQRRGVTINARTELATSLPPSMGVESEIREALTNLIFNAVDAMAEGGTLTLRTRQAGEGKLQTAVLEVIDTGAGMDEATRQRCLEPFFTTKGERGTGLGLAMVFGMAQRHGAELEIDSTPGAGTTMRLVFTARSGAAALTGESAAPQVLKRLRLLLVDDDPILLKSLRDALETDSHVVVTANGGEAGIAEFRASLARSEHYAAVFTDLGMPNVDGRKVAAAVKATSPATPVILLTGWGQRMVAEGDIPPHVDRVLAKPPKLRELRETLAHLCGPQTPSISG
jgi:PAS domain S-box-containing protein